MQRALLAITLGIAIVHVAAQIETLQRTCRSAALDLSERLAAYHCRHVTPMQFPLMPPPDLDQTVNAMLSLTQNVYGKYDFVHGEIPKPSALTPRVASAMMTACLLQHASVNLLRGALPREDIQVPKDCVKEVLDLHFYKPLDGSKQILRALNFDAMFELPHRHQCLEMVMSGFAREYIEMVKLPAPPEHPGIGDQIWGIRLKSQRVDMSTTPKYVEWPTLWMYLKAWKRGELKGWTLEYPNGVEALPICTIWFYESRFKS